MRVLFTANSLDMGGIEMNLVRLAAAMTARGHNVTVASRGGLLAPALRDAGATHVTLELSRSPAGIWRDVRRLRGLLDAGGVTDVVHVMSASTGPLVLAARASRRRRAVAFASPMGLRTHPDEAGWRVLLRAKLVTAGAGTIISISPEITRTIERLRIRPARLVSRSVVGVEAPPPDRRDEARRRLRDELGVTPDTSVVTTIGRLDPTKSHHLFIAAADHLRHSGPAAVFAIVGGGRLRAELERDIDARGCGDVVRLLGERQDVRGLLAGTDVYVRPGVVEGFVGITVLEAQATGIPVVSFDTTDVRLAIDDGVSGLLVDNGDPVAMAEGIRRLLLDHELRRSIAAAGYKRWQATYELGAIADGLLGLYLDRLGRAPVPPTES
ncbi:MAG: glycosyltransferase family 4 protein [Actinobacteria bacterium]|nr:glycosyltransferase family 4 protein [Actinomycetota bacterium]